MFDYMHKLESAYPSFIAIVNCFGFACHAQAMVEDTTTPTMMPVIPLCEELKRKLGLIFNGILEGSNFVPSSIEDNNIATTTRSALNKIQLHDLWYCSCLLHPGFSTLSFIRDFTTRYLPGLKGETILRKLVKNLGTYDADDESLEVKQIIPLG